MNNQSKLDNLFVIDVETSGPDYFSSLPLSVSIVPVDSHKPTFSGFIKYDDFKWSGRGEEFFQEYKNQWLSEALEPKDFCKKFDEYIGQFLPNSITFVGHNVGFDIHFLHKVYNDASRIYPNQISHRVIDTHSLLFYLSLKGYLHLASNSSDDAFNFFGLYFAQNERHTSLADAKKTRMLFLKILELPEMHHLHKI